MTDSKAHILDQLPARLKQKRQDLGLSLEAVSKLSGVSRSMLSQIERGESSPTVATLWNLTRALQVDFAGLLNDDRAARDIEVLRADEAPTLRPTGAGCVIRILSPPQDVGRHEVYDIRFDDGGCLDSAPHSPGTREHITVLSGAVRLTCDAEERWLGAQDSARYWADVRHRIEARGSAHVFMIVKGD